MRWRVSHNKPRTHAAHMSPSHRRLLGTDVEPSLGDAFVNLQTRLKDGVLRIRASELATACNLHPYLSARDMSVALWERQCQTERCPNSVATEGWLHLCATLRRDTLQTIIATFTDAISTLQEQCAPWTPSRPPQGDARETHGHDQDALHVLRLIKLLGKFAARAPTTEACDALERNCMSLVQRTLPESMHAAATLALRRSTNVNRGRTNEQCDIDTFQERTGIAIVRRNTEYATKSLGTIHGVQVSVTGVCDGFTEEGAVLESKNRRHKLLGNVPQHERIQLELYLWLFECATAIHVENCNGEFNMTLYKHDPALWIDMITHLERFVADLAVLAMDPKAREQASCAWRDQQQRGMFGKRPGALSRRAHPSAP